MQTDESSRPEPPEEDGTPAREDPPPAPKGYVYDAASRRMVPVEEAEGAPPPCPPDLPIAYNYVDPWD